MFFDTETSGFINKNLEADDPNQAWVLQIAFILSDKNRIYTEFSSLIRAGDRSCSPGAQKVHGISVEECNKGGLIEAEIINIFSNTLFGADILVAHNISFDLELVRQMICREDLVYLHGRLEDFSLFCTMKNSTELCKLPGKFGKFKWPKLTELYKHLFDEEFEGAHDALADVKATRRCYYRLKEMGV